MLRKTILAGVFGLGLATAASAQTLELAVDQSPAGLDPHITTAFSSLLVWQSNIYEGLTAVDKDLRVVPSLAESWTISPDGKTYTFKLRPGVKFHDGAAMTADDVVASFRRVMSKDIASPFASRLASVTGITAPDPQTVELKLSEPAAPLLGGLSTIAIVPKAMETNKDALQKTPDGTGPFKFQEWQPNGFILLTKNDAYWEQGLPKLAGLKFNIVPESATRQVGLTSGQYQMLPNIDAATALQLKGKPGVKVYDTLELGYSLIGVNTSKPPFDNPKAREALNYALNRPEIVQAALFGAGVPGGPLSPALKDWAVNTSDFACYKPDPAKAQALLKEAGIAMPVAVTINVFPRQDLKDIAQVAQAEMNKAGFKVELKNQELGQFVQDWRNSNFDAFVSANGGNVDPDDYFFRTFKTAASTNVFKYSNADIDKQLDSARAIIDQKGRKGVYDEVQKTLACTGPIAHVAYATLFTAASDKLTGYDIIANRALSSLRSASLAK